MKAEKNEIKLLRHLLNSIDISDVEMKQYSEEEQKEVSNAIKIFYDVYAKDEIQNLINAQRDFTVRECYNMEQLMFARGTINGLCLIKDWFLINGSIIEE